MGIDLNREPDFDKLKPSYIINDIALQTMKIYKASDGIWATSEEAQRNVNVDDDKHVGDDEEAKEADVRDMEEGDEPMLKGVDEFTTPHSAIDKH